MQVESNKKKKKKQTEQHFNVLPEMKTEVEFSFRMHLPVSVPLPCVSMCLSNGGHAVGQAVQAPSVQAQTSVGHVAVKHNIKKISCKHHKALPRFTIKGLRLCSVTLCF